MKSLATKYGNMDLSMSEALRASSISSIWPAQQAPAGANVGPGPTLPRKLSTHPYSQRTFPLWPFANVTGYPSLPQSCTHMPSALARNSTHHQSLAAMLEQYKNSLSVSSLPQSAAVASGYGFGSSNSVPGSNFPLNPPTAPTGTTLDYDDLFSSPYEEASHLIPSLQRNENPVLSFHGPGSRILFGVAGSAHNSFQQPNQQAAQFREAQRQLQQFVAPGYQDYYQKALLLKHQQQNFRDRPF